MPFIRDKMIARPRSDTREETWLRKQEAFIRQDSSNLTDCTAVTSATGPVAVMETSPGRCRWRQADVLRTDDAYLRLWLNCTDR